MTFLQLKQQLLDELFSGNQQENLVAAHNNFFVQAMYDLQRAVPCYRYGNKDVYPHCATYFECGLTVVPAPRGEIVEVYVIDKINPDTGLEDATALDDWCAKVFYSPVRYCELQRFRCLCERVPTTSILSVADSLAELWWGVYRIKRSYPRPTDEGLTALPLLPEGRHYPQTSTDAGGRSPGGRFAIERGRLYIAPWIQSTETLIVKWNGIKRKWNDDDLVDDDPKVLQAIRLNVAIQHYIAYENNPGKLAELKAQYGNPDLGQWGALQDLIDECRRESEAVQCREAGNSASAARGFGAEAPTLAFTNSVRVSRTAYCPQGQTGGSVTVVKEIGTVGSAFSVEDANSRAAQQALDEATARLICTTPEVVYSSAATVGHASCPGASGTTPAADGDPVSVPVPAGFRTSTESQEAADAAAQTAADALAREQLSCTYWNAPQTVTVTCPGDLTGDDEAIPVPAHTFPAESQALADSAARAESTRLGLEALECSGPVTTYWNETQTLGPFVKGCSRIVSGNLFLTFSVYVTVIVPAGKRSGATQIEANTNASNYGNEVWNAIASSGTYCNQFAQPATPPGIDYERTVYAP